MGSAPRGGREDGAARGPLPSREPSATPLPTSSGTRPLPSHRARLGRDAGPGVPESPRPSRPCPRRPHLGLRGGALRAPGEAGSDGLRRGAERGRGAAPSGPRGRAPTRLPCEPSAPESGARGDPERRRRRRQLLVRARAACQGRRVPADPSPHPLPGPPPARPDPPASAAPPPPAARSSRLFSELGARPFLRCRCRPWAPTLRCPYPTRTLPSSSTGGNYGTLNERRPPAPARCAQPRYPPIANRSPADGRPSPPPTSVLTSPLPVTLLTRTPHSLRARRALRPPVL